MTAGGPPIKEGFCGKDVNKLAAGRIHQNRVRRCPPDCPWFVAQAAARRDSGLTPRQMADRVRQGGAPAPEDSCIQP